MLQRYSDRRAILLSAALFASMHAYLVKLPVAFVFAVGVSLLYLASRSLWLPVLAQVVNNSVFIPATLLGKGVAAPLIPVPYAAVLFVAGSAMVFVAGRRTLLRLLRRAPRFPVRLIDLLDRTWPELLHSTTPA